MLKMNKQPNIAFQNPEVMFHSDVRKNRQAAAIIKWLRDQEMCVSFTKIDYDKLVIWE